MAIACLPLAGRYEIVKPLNSGGMGAVYEARDLRLNDSPCAVKQLLHSRGKGEYLNAKFEAEMAVLASLDHPGIPKIRDFFTENGRRYLVMDLIPGPNLYQVLETGGPLEARGLVQEMLQALEIIGYLHGRDILHRDVKPANLIRDSRCGRLRLVDFGLARSFEVGEITQTLVGTSGYAPPEQLAGRAEPASDLYALGATMLHLLTGVSPLFAYPTLDKALDPALLAVLRKAVAMHPRERYPDAASFSAALQGWLNAPQEASTRRHWLAGVSASLATAAFLGLALPRPAAPAVGVQPAVLAQTPAPAVVAVAQPVAIVPAETNPPVAPPIPEPPAVAPAPAPAPVPRASTITASSAGDSTVQARTAAQAVVEAARDLAQLSHLPSLTYPLAGPRKPRQEVAFQPVLGSEVPSTVTPEPVPVLSTGGPLFLRQHGLRLHIPFGYEAHEENGEIVAVPGHTLAALPHREVRARFYQSADSAMGLVANFKAKARASGEVQSEEELPDGYRLTVSDQGNTLFYRILVRERGKLRYVCETTGKVESQDRGLVSQVQPFFARSTMDGKTPLLAVAPIMGLSYRSVLDAQVNSSSATSTSAATAPAAAPATTTTAPATTAPAPTAPPTAPGTTTAPATPVGTTTTPATTTPASVSVPLGVAPTSGGGGAGGFVGGYYGPVNLPTSSNQAPAPPAGYGGPPAAVMPRR